jgi:hypothetical protein
VVVKYFGFVMSWIPCLFVPLAQCFDMGEMYYD